MHDTFQLFKFYMEGKMGELESKLVREQDAMSKKLKDDVSIKFKHEGNKIQVNFNVDVMDVLKKLYKQIPKSETQCMRFVFDLLDKTKARNKLIRIADSPLACWSTVKRMSVMT